VDLDSGAGLLHRLTSYVPNREWDVPVDDPRVRHDLVPNDLATLPPQMKAYPDGLPVLSLHGVDDVAPGLYRWPDLSTPLRVADLRDELARICLDQSGVSSRESSRPSAEASRPSRWATRCSDSASGGSAVDARRRFADIDAGERNLRGGGCQHRGSHYALSLISRSRITSGQHVLVNGATGAIGSAAVQL
jgi:hypothetical protein